MKFALTLNSVEVCRTISWQLKSALAVEVNLTLAATPTQYELDLAEADIKKPLLRIE